MLPPPRSCTHEGDAADFTPPRGSAHTATRGMVHWSPGPDLRGF